MKKIFHITLKDSCRVTNIEEYLWMIYDTTDVEKIDSHIETETKFCINKL